MNKTLEQRSDDFLRISGQFKLGVLVTEGSHPVTANLSEVARTDIAAALKLLLEVDADVLRAFREFVASGRAGAIRAEVVQALANGGRIFFTGCGSTGRLSILLDSVWRDFWQNAGDAGAKYVDRTFSVMSGGDYALIKSVEGFEDFAVFGRKQMTDLAVSARDVVFAITEGGETSFVIGTAWAGVDAGAKVYFVYNNPDAILCQHVERSREVIQDARIEKINLTTGPMAISGSTRMQATSIQLCVMLTVLEMVARELTGQPAAAVSGAGEELLAGLAAAHAGLLAPEFLAALATLVALQETTYRQGRKHDYFASHLAIDVLTDTTERSPTYCTPPFRKFDDLRATESWAFLFVPETRTELAWERLLKRPPRCVEWSPAEVRALVPPENAERSVATIEKIRTRELLRYKIDCAGMPHRPLVTGDSATAVLVAREHADARQFLLAQLAAARGVQARTGLLYFGPENPALAAAAEAVAWVPVPASKLLLDGVTRVVVKLVLNALSTCTMVRLGRVMGNYMVWVVPSNLKLIDRATRYIVRLTGLEYAAANRLLFEIIGHVEPRMKADQAYPPVVRMAVLRAKGNLANAEAEARIRAEARGGV